MKKRSWKDSEIHQLKTVMKENNLNHVPNWMTKYFPLRSINSIRAKWVRVRNEPITQLELDFVRPEPYRLPTVTDYLRAQGLRGKVTFDLGE